METAGNTVSAIVPTAEDSLPFRAPDDEYDGIEYDVTGKVRHASNCDDASYLTGTTIDINGGSHIH
jgi:hypothetical protein